MKKILLVVRDIGLAEKLYQTCRKAQGGPIEPVHATSLAGGFCQLEEDTFEIIVCHTNLDDGNGLDLMKKVRTTSPKTRIIGITPDSDMRSLMVSHCDCVASPKTAAAELAKCI
ncbi:MAG: Response regulator receiver domain [Patescibacteria group bacterium]|nr:Response regulator receiver domain [Patescibacteria group bacterium]